MGVVMLDYVSTLKESESLAGPLGATVFVVRKAIEVGGAPDKALKEFDLMVQTCFSELSDEDCNTLCEVLYHRLQEARSMKPDGRWYA